jgi:hypothetical protein
VQPSRTEPPVEAGVGQPVCVGLPHHAAQVLSVPIAHDGVRREPQRVPGELSLQESSTSSPDVWYFSFQPPSARTTSAQIPTLLPTTYGKKPTLLGRPSAANVSRPACAVLSFKLEWSKRPPTTS